MRSLGAWAHEEAAAADHRRRLVHGPKDSFGAIRALHPRIPADERPPLLLSLRALPFLMGKPDLQHGGRGGVLGRPVAVEEHKDQAGVFFGELAGAVFGPGFGEPGTDLDCS
ncbi:hypothetical protein ACH4TV_46320 [Streptomyces sp. NPDC020898]|uniref:hypothetical protein n=1 Tax=Streptomyces sp. NPDC020898 TaxID=3365101 RepID=UPI0037B3B191